MNPALNNENFIEGFAVVSVLKPKWGWMLLSRLIGLVGVPALARMRVLVK